MNDGASCHPVHSLARVLMDGRLEARGKRLPRFFPAF